METIKNSAERSIKVVLSNHIEDDDFRNIISQIEGDDSIKTLKLDFRNVLYMYSKNIAGLISLKKFCNEKHIDMILTNLSESVLQLLEIADLVNLFKIEEDYSSYAADELVKFFLDPEKADFMTEYLARHYTDDVKNSIYAAIKSDDPILKEYAIITAGKAQDHTLIKEIRDCLQDDTAAVVRAAALVLGWFNDVQSKDSLIALLESEYIDIVEAAAISVALMATEKDSLTFGKLLQSDDDKKRRIAVNALGLINDDLSYNLLMERYKVEKNVSVKALILRTLSFFKKEGLVDFFVNELTNDSIEIQEAATSALVRLKATDKIESLLEKFDEKNNWVSYFAVKALGELGRSRKILDELIKYYNKSPLHVKIAIVDAIGKICIRLKDINSSDLLRFMREVLNENNEDLRKIALEVIVNVSKEDGIAEAIKLLDLDDSWLVRLKCVEIISTLKPAGYEKILEKHLEKEKNRYVIEKIKETI